MKSIINKIHSCSDQWFSKLGYAIAVVTIANYQTVAAMANPNAGFGGRGGGGHVRGFLSDCSSHSRCDSALGLIKPEVRRRVYWTNVSNIPDTRAEPSR